MKIIETDILIIGAGLTGLTIAYLLRQQNIAVTIVEGRERVGGRIYTKYNETLAPQEMGATWFGKNHTALVD
jgi:monoamine oxidase